MSGSSNHPRVGDAVDRAQPSAPAARGTRRGRATAVAQEAVAAVAAFGLFAFVITQIPPEITAIRLLAWTTFVGGAGFVAMAVGEAVRHDALVGAGTVDGRPGVGVRAWRGELWHSLLVDATLMVAAVGLTVLDLNSGGFFWPWSLLPLVAAVWLVVRIGLYLTGRKNIEGLWVSNGQIVHETTWGLERLPLESVRVIVAEGRTLVIVGDDEPTRKPCPRLWRDRLPSTDGIAVPTRDFGHEADALAEWLSSFVPNEPLSGLNPNR